MSDLQAQFERLDALRELEDGWYDGDCDAPSEESLHNTKHLLAVLALLGLPYPSIGPHLEGGVFLEWEEGLIVGILNSGTAYLHPEEGDEVADLDFNLSIRHIVKELVNGSAQVS